ncbi:endonuclease V [Halorussus halophilus]|uniref:endonuclease V n=1 Tax=Halorussus halophilus TaxID=2650975 RepID=UPI0013012500|nr:endonuclease V [Halorussus halophilus]
MDPVHPEFVPDPSLSRAEMEQVQRDIADAAVFEDDFSFDPTNVGTDATEASERSQTTLDETTEEREQRERERDPPMVVGVDQAFTSDGEQAISAIVAVQDGDVVERVHAVEPCQIPYIPGLLSFREGGAILSAFEELSVEPDLAIVDGSGRIHFRQAGLATHVGVTLDLPAIGVAKNLLCGRAEEPLDEPLPEGVRVPIKADEDVTAPEGTVIGYALQSKQYDNPSRRYVNPLYVSPGHRVSAKTATELVWRLCAGYKLPEPTRLADAYADEVKSER